MNLLGRCKKCEKFVYNEDFDKSSLENFSKDGLCVKCQKKNYDVYFFIDKFNKIPEEQWTELEYHNFNKFCALGHCGEIDSKYPTNESIALDDLFNKYELRVSLVNDNKCPKYSQETPKQRIIAALEDIRKMEELS